MSRDDVLRNANEAVGMNIFPVAAVDEPAHSWEPINLVQAASLPPEPPTIGGVLYPGRRSLISGETEALKTWFALILAKAEMDAGYAVCWADVDAMGRGEIFYRLRSLGATDEQISELFLFIEPEERLVGAMLDETVRRVRDRNVRLFVCDAFNGMLGLHGLDLNSTADVERFWQEVAGPICKAGAAWTNLDHVVKNADNRGKYSYGSERKASGSHVHLGLRPITQFGRGQSGSSRIYTYKDRGAFLQKPVIGILELVSDGDQVGYSLAQDKSRTRDKFRPTFLMEKVSQHLAAQGGAVSRNHVEQGVPGKADAIRTAIDVLVEEGFAQASDGPNRARLVESIRDYREDEDAVEADDDSGSSLVRPGFVPNLVSTPSSVFVPSSLSYRGTKTNRRDEFVPGGSSRPSTPPAGFEDAAPVFAGVVCPTCDHDQFFSNGRCKQCSTPTSKEET